MIFGAEFFLEMEIFSKSPTALGLVRKPSSNGLKIVITFLETNSIETTFKD
jgi:hypothetical protein